MAHKSIIMTDSNPPTLPKPKYNKANSLKGYQKTILVNQLDEAFKRLNGKFSFVYEPKKPDYGWHPSGDCLPSVSALWHQAYGTLHPDYALATKDLSHLNKIFMVGHYWHQIIQFLIVENGWAAPEAIERIAYRTWNGDDVQYWRDSEIECDPFHYVRGQGDIAPLVMSGWSGLVDIKTMNSDDFKRGLLASRFMKKYLAQINIYMDLFGCDQAMILAVDKSSGVSAEYTFVKDEDLVQQVYAKWQRVSELLMRDTEPSLEDDRQYALSIGDE